MKKLLKKLLAPIIREVVREEENKKEQAIKDLVLSEMSRCLKDSYSLSNLPGDIQTHNQHLSHNTGLKVLILEAQCEDKPGEGNDTETQTGLAGVLQRQIRDVNNLAEVLDYHPKTPMRLRTYSPQFVDTLIYRTKMLTSMLSVYVIPRLEQTNSNRR